MEDNRSDSDKKGVGYGFAIWKSLYSSKTPPAKIIFNALQTEFENNGHKIYEKMEGNDGIIFSVKLNKFFLDYRQRPNGRFEFLGKIIADLDVIDAKNNKSIFSKTCHTTTRYPAGGLNIDSTYEKPFNNTVKQFIQDLLYDFSLINTLKKI